MFPNLRDAPQMKVAGFSSRGDEVLQRKSIVKDDTYGDDDDDDDVMTMMMIMMMMMMMMMMMTLNTYDDDDDDVQVMISFIFICESKSITINHHAQCVLTVGWLLLILRLKVMSWSLDLARRGGFCRVGAGFLCLCMVSCLTPMPLVRPPFILVAFFILGRAGGRLGPFLAGRLGPLPGPYLQRGDLPPPFCGFLTGPRRAEGLALPRMALTYRTRMYFGALPFPFPCPGLSFCIFLLFHLPFPLASFLPLTILLPPRYLTTFPPFAFGFPFTIILLKYLPSAPLDGYLQGPFRIIRINFLSMGFFLHLAATASTLFADSVAFAAPRVRLPVSQIRPSLISSKYFHR
jgi:hypothetical protein